jgi:hypothetical protein
MNATSRWKRPAALTVLLLAVPLFATAITDAVQWGPLDFLVGGGLLFTAGVVYETISARWSDRLHRTVLGFVLLIGVSIIWAQLAVGITG